MGASAPVFDPLIAEARFRMRRRRVLFALAAVLIVGAALGTPLALRRTTAVSQAEQRPALGSVRFAGPIGSGWGRAHPTVIYNGGDQTGRAWHIVWKHWGSPTATGVGRTRDIAPYHFSGRELGPYYRTPLKIEFRATDLGRCTRSGRLAYRRLEAREQFHPGGTLSGWGNWSPIGTICRSESP